MMSAQHTLGIVFFPAFDWAISPTHPEREERLLYTQDQLAEEGIFDIEGIDELKPDIAAAEDVLRVHWCFPDVASLVTDSHLVSAGGAIRAARAVMEGETDKAFALVRPPGHHAMKCVHGHRGFCGINIEAIMVEYIRRHYGPQRVAIIDTDCHHGDGTQDIYWHDPDTLFISLHQDGRTLYPGTGFTDELGGPTARGKTLNIPLPPGTSDEGFLSVIDNLVLPVLEDFSPDLVINSAGQDNHFSDPLTDMNFSARGYGALTERLQADIAVLEGGYSIQGALPYVNLGIILAMAGLDFSGVQEPRFDPARYRQGREITETIKATCDAVSSAYFSPPPFAWTSEDKEDWHVLTRRIHYDTDGITEQQRQNQRLCPDCCGFLYVETRSDRGGLCMGIDLPAAACDRCSSLARALFEQGQAGERYSHCQFIDRQYKKTTL